MKGQGIRREGWRVSGAMICLVAVAYYGAAKLGLSFAFATTSVTAIWPPTGLALAALVLWGYRVWPGVVAGAFLANVWTGVPLLVTVGITCGNTLEALVGAYLLRRVADFRPSLERSRDVLALVILAAIVSTTVSATIGVGSLVVGDEVATDSFGSVWRVWWLGDVGGDLLIAPLLLVAATQWPFDRAPGRALEAAVLAVAVLGVSAFVFSQQTNLAYVLFPLLIWAALRFWQPGAAAASFAVAAIAVAFTANDMGPFVRANPDDSLLLAQTFVGVAGITVMLLAAVITERRHADAALAHIARTLQTSLLPSALPEIPAVETAARFRAAQPGLEVGGDFYDVFDSGEGSWAIVVGDVCGKGPEAAALTALARYTLRATVMHERSPSRNLELLNEALLRHSSETTLCTAAFARLDRQGSTARVTVSAGGHPLPLLLRADGTVESLGRPGLLLGFEHDLELGDDTRELRAGDAILLYTDGLTDAYAPSRSLEIGDLTSLLGACAGRSAAEIADHMLHAALDSDTARPRDDIAVVVIRIAPETADRLVPDSATTSPGSAGDGHLTASLGGSTTG